MCNIQKQITKILIKILLIWKIREYYFIKGIKFKRRKHSVCEFNLNAPDGGNKSNVENFYFPTCNFTRDEMRNCKTKKIFIRDCETRSRLTFSRLPLSLARLQKRSRRRAKRERRVADVFRDFSKRGKISISLTIATTNHVYTSRTLALDRRSTLAHSLSLFLTDSLSGAGIMARKYGSAGNESDSGGGTPRRELLYDFWG